MSDCPHEIWERESDVTADGSCPICLRAEIERLKAEDDVSYELLADAKAEIEQLKAEVAALREQPHEYVLEAEKQIERLRAENERLQSIIRKQMSPTEISQRLAECNQLSDAYAEQTVIIKELRTEIKKLRAEVSK